MLFYGSLRTGKTNAYGWLRYSGFARHKDPSLMQLEHLLICLCSASI